MSEIEMTNDPLMGAALIVGAGPRLGASIARVLGADGRGVGLVGRSADTTAALAAALADEGLRTASAAADVADADALTAAIGRLQEQVGGFAVAVHNVSAWRDGGAGAVDAGDLLADLAAGATSLLTITNAVLPAMTASGSGTIIATGSAAADHPTAGAPSLGIQKAALRTLAVGLAAELAPRGIHCATVTINGVLGTDGFDPARIAEEYGALVAETGRAPETWRTVVTFDGA